MKLSELFKEFLHRMRSNRAQSDRQPQSPQSQEVLKALLGAIKQTQEIELTCEETFDLLDQYAEMVMKNEDVSQLLPLVKRHLDMCLDCREEYEALIRVLMNPPVL